MRNVIKQKTRLIKWYYFHNMHINVIVEPCDGSEAAPLRFLLTNCYNECSLLVTPDLSFEPSQVLTLGVFLSPFYSWMTSEPGIAIANHFLCGPGSSDSLGTLEHVFVWLRLPHVWPEVGVFAYSILLFPRSHHMFLESDLIPFLISALSLLSSTELSSRKPL